VSRFELRQDGDDDEATDNAHDDLKIGDGVPRGAMLVLRGHHVAALACVARSCTDPTAAEPAREIAAATCERLRNRAGVPIARALEPLDIADTAYIQELSTTAEHLRTQAERLGPAALAEVIDAEAARRLCAAATAWLGGDTLPAHEIEALATKVAAGAEVWGGLGNARGFLRVPLLWSGLDPTCPHRGWLREGTLMLCAAEEP
jgi:hypothetical protein